MLFLKSFITSLILFVYVGLFAQVKQPSYDSLDYWASHPEKDDMADISGNSNNLSVDVFYIYPTIYTKRPFRNFNANLEDDKLNNKIQETAIRNQASVFSGLANVYAPYYRQMHLHGYYTKNKKKKAQALAAFDTAYSDVVRAFNYYLLNYNFGKPFVIAGHSQGTNHSERLLKEVILTNDSLRKKLALAYLVGMPIKNDFNQFMPCEQPDQTGCFLTWRTFGDDFIPKVKGDSIVCCNPITFNASVPNSKLEDHQGVLLKDGKLKMDQSIIASVSDGYLEIEIVAKPEKWIYNWNNYHVADYNLFWQNIHDNFELRMAEFLAKKD